MGLGAKLQSIAINLAVKNKEKLFAMFLVRLDKEYDNNRLQIAEGVFHYLPASWKVTATIQEMGVVIDLTKHYIEDMYVAIQAMRAPALPPASPGARPAKI